MQPTTARPVRWLATGLALLLATGCATTPVPPPARPPSAARPPEAPPEVATAGAILSGAATPVFVVLKAAVCAATVVIAIPGAAILGLTDEAYETRGREDLDEGLARNCGPPWALR